MTDTVVISGATPVPAGAATEVALLSVPELADMAIADRGTDVALVLRNRTGAPLRVAVEGVGDIAIPPGGGTVVPLPAEPEEARLHLQVLSATLGRVVMLTVTVEPSDEGLIALAQAIGARTC